MDFLEICTGLGLALAVGLIIGVVVPPIMPAWGVIAGAAPLGVIACGAALNGADEAVWPALPVGILASGLAATVSRDVAAGATRRQRGSLEADDVRARTPGGLAALTVLAAALVAALSVFVPPFSLVALVALAGLWLSRRRAAEQKHEGLRV